VGTQLVDSQVALSSIELVTELAISWSLLEQLTCKCKELLPEGLKLCMICLYSMKFDSSPC
jgi:hypothetical protein